MVKRKTRIQKSLLLFFLLHLMVCQAFHEYHDFKETEIISSNPLLKNSHSDHDHPIANEANKFSHLIFSNISSLAIIPLTVNLFPHVSYRSIPSLISDQKATILRC